MIWSEEYQAKVYKYQTDMLSRNDAVQGTPWILKDFRSAMRNLNGVQEIYNRKGLISERGEKKKAYFVLKDSTICAHNICNGSYAPTWFLMHSIARKLDIDPNEP